MKRLCAAVAVMVLGFAPVAFAQDDTPGEQLGGFDSSASAVAMSFQPFLPALISTGDVPFEGSISMSSARVKSGGNAFGRAALLWPGATAADLGPVLGVAFGQPELGSLIPKWPVQAEANQDAGEVTTGAPPVATMRAVGQKDRSEADSRVADVHVPRIVRIDNISSVSKSIVTDSSVGSEAIVKLHGVTLLAGFITMEEIRSVSRTTSIGSAASSSGDVDIIGLKIGGVNVSVTDDGFQVDGLPPDAKGFPGAGGKPAPGTSPEEIVNAALETVGARITLFESISSVKGSAAQRMQPGVVVSVENPAGGQGPIPPGRFDIFLASSQASALSSPPFVAGEFGGGSTAGGDTASDGGSTEGGGTISIGDGPEVSGGSVSDVGGDMADVVGGSLGPPPGGMPNIVEAMPQSGEYRFNGLSSGFVFVVLGGALIAARYIRRFLVPLIGGS